MPGLDGTGPMGLAPLSGRGGGFCVLRIGQRGPDDIAGFAGVDGKLVKT